jgi:HAD superfamily hydrolase (TIGR01458 family)
MFRHRGKPKMIRGLLSDVHGVLYTYPHAIPGSVEAVRRLRRAGFPHLFLTNSTLYPRSWILGTLRDLGFEIDDDEFLTAAQVAGDLLAARGYRRVGWLCVPDLAEDLPDLVPVLPEASADGHVDAVLVGDLGDGFTPAVLTRAFHWLHDGAALVALALNRYYQGPDGLVLDCGPFVKLLEYAAETEALVVGKPSLEFFRAGVRRLGLSPGEVAMVGDDLLGDVLPAMDAGLTGIQARTGKYREDRYAASERKADRVVADLAEAVELVLGGADGRQDRD